MFFSRSGKSQGKRCFFQSQGKVLEKEFLAKVREFYDERALLVVQLLSFSDKRLRQFLPFCIIVVIINLYTHFVPYKPIKHTFVHILSNILSTFHAHI